MFQLVRNTLTNKEGFMIFILWNHLWVAGWIAYQMDVNFWKVTSAGLLATLIVSPLYFIRKDSYLIRYLVGIGLLYYSIAFDHYTPFQEISFLAFIVLGFLAAYLDWKLIVSAGAMQVAATLIGFYRRFLPVV